jgi:L-asparagine oxygenase
MPRVSSRTANSRQTQLSHMCCKKLDRFGFVRFSSPSEVHTADVARTLGDVVSLDSGSEVQTLAPVTSEVHGQNRYSGIYKNGPFPFHTDLAHWYRPPRFVLLRCIQASSNVTTYLLHSRKLIKPDEQWIVLRALFRARRRQDGRITCMRLLERDCFRWDPLFLLPINRLAVELRTLVLQRISESSAQSVVLNTPGDCLLVDNWRSLHGRSNVPRNSYHRMLERVYLDGVRR